MTNEVRIAFATAICYFWLHYISARDLNDNLLRNFFMSLLRHCAEKDYYTTKWSGMKKLF